MWCLAAMDDRCVHRTRRLRGSSIGSADESVVPSQTATEYSKAGVFVRFQLLYSLEYPACVLVCV